MQLDPQDEIVGSNSNLLQMQGPSQKHNGIARVGTFPISPPLVLVLRTKEEPTRELSINSTGLLSGVGPS